MYGRIVAVEFFLHVTKPVAYFHIPANIQP